MSHSLESPPPNPPIQPLIPPQSFAHPIQYITIPNCPPFRPSLSIPILPNFPQLPREPAQQQQQQYQQQQRSNSVYYR